MILVTHVQSHSACLEQLYPEQPRAGIIPPCLNSFRQSTGEESDTQRHKRAVTVAVEDHVTVLLVCQTFGRPRPTDVKLTKVDDDNFADAHKAQVSNAGRWRSESTVTLSDVQCSDMGTYVCTASNGVGPADSRSVLLNVKCESWVGYTVT